MILSFIRMKHISFVISPCRTAAISPVVFLAIMILDVDCALNKWYGISKGLTYVFSVIRIDRDCCISKYILYYLVFPETLPGNRSNLICWYRLNIRYFIKQIDIYALSLNIRHIPKFQLLATKFIFQ